MNPLFDAALCRSTLIHYTLQFYTKREQRSFCSAQNPASFGVKLAYGVVSAGYPLKEKACNFSYYQEVSGFVSLKLEIYCSIGFIVGCGKIQPCFRPTGSNNILKTGEVHREQSVKLQHCPRKLYTVLFTTHFPRVLTETGTDFVAGC